MQEILSLYELSFSVRNLIKKSYSRLIWVKGEISSIMENRTGHCYMELVEKRDEKLLASMRAIIWSSDYAVIKPKFVHTTRKNLEKGMQVMLLVELTFSEIYGCSLVVRDINSEFTLGDMERAKLEAIERLKAEGVFDMNKMLELSEIPKTIAVISSPTAAGWGDFQNQLINNSKGYKFHIKLFPALMQGDATTASIIQALDRIMNYEMIFDAVIIIRGGGGNVDLSCFNTYELSTNIAQYPLPVLTGIGHERDISVADMVAFKSLKTPTAVAEFLIDRFSLAEQEIDKLRDDFLLMLNQTITEEKQRQKENKHRFIYAASNITADSNSNLRLFVNKLKYASQAMIKEAQTGYDDKKNRINKSIKSISEICNRDLNLYKKKLEDVSKNIFLRNKNILDISETKVKYINPYTIMERGYSIATFNGKILKNVEELTEGDIVEIMLIDGKVKTKVLK